MIKVVVCLGGGGQGSHGVWGSGIWVLFIIPHRRQEANAGCNSQGLPLCHPFPPARMKVPKGSTTSPNTYGGHVLLKSRQVAGDSRTHCKFKSQGEALLANSLRHPCFTCTMVGDAKGCPVGVTGLTGMNSEGQNLWDPSLSHVVCLTYTTVTIENHGEKRGERGPLKATQRRRCKELGSTKARDSISTRSRASTGDFENSVSVTITRLVLQGGQRGKRRGKETLQRDQSVFSHAHFLGRNLTK